MSINPTEMLRLLDGIARERKIEKSMLIKDLEQAMVSAARKHYNTLDTEEFKCTIDQLTGEMNLTRHGEALNIAPQELGRIAAQTFKQVMIQRFRDDERSSLMTDFGKRVGEIVTGVVQRYDGGSLVVTIDRAEAFMPRSEQIPGEMFQPSDRIRALCLDVRDVGNQVKIVLSRSHPDFIKKLFEIEVPEVTEHVIEIKAMAREPGYRTKVAVASVDSKVDPVGACVGIRGSRIKNIVDELNGEKIDIVRWNESSQILIGNALKPAEVKEISLCFELGRATVVVRDDQLSLAIGKRGQNVRLAARLTGWDVDILTPGEYEKGLDIMSTTLKEIPGVTDQHLDKLLAMGMVSVFDVEEVGTEVLTGDVGMDEAVAKTVVEIASTKAKEVAIVQQAEKEASERKRRELEASGGILGLDAPGIAAPTTEDAARAADVLGGSTGGPVPAAPAETVP